jgi:hypothetical protein
MDSVAFGVAVAQGEPGAGRGVVGAYHAAGRLQGAVEEHRLDADVVVEPFQVALGSCGNG